MSSSGEIDKAKEEARQASEKAEQLRIRLEEQTAREKERAERDRRKAQRLLMRSIRASAGGFFETDKNTLGGSGVLG